MGTNQETIIYIENNDKTTAAKAAQFYTIPETKNRVYINSLGCELVMKYLAQENIDVKNIFNLHNINKIHEEFDIADIMLPNIHLDVRMIYDENRIFIPKSHFEYNLVPDLYLVLQISEDGTYANFLGFFEPKIINKNNQNDKYYFVEKEKLSPVQDLITFIENFNGNTTEALSEEDLDTARRLALSLIDHDIHENDKKLLFNILLKSSAFREEAADFDSFELISYHLATNEDIEYSAANTSIDEFDMFDTPDEFDNLNEEFENNTVDSITFDNPVENITTDNSLPLDIKSEDFTLPDNIDLTDENIPALEKNPTDDLPLDDLGQSDDELTLDNLENPTDDLPLDDLEQSNDELVLDNLENPTDDLPLDDLGQSDDELSLDNLETPTDDLPLDDLEQSNDELVLDNLENQTDDLPLDDLGHSDDELSLDNLENPTDDLPLDDLEQSDDELVLDNLENPTDDLPLDDLEQSNDELVLDNLENPTDDLPLDDLEQSNDELTLDNLENPTDDLPLDDLEQSDDDSTIQTPDISTADEISLDDTSALDDIQPLEEIENFEFDTSTTNSENLTNENLTKDNDENKDTQKISFEEIDMLYSEDLSYNDKDDHSKEIITTAEETNINDTEHPTDNSDTMSFDEFGQTADNIMQTDIPATNLGELSETVSKPAVYENSVSINNKQDTFTPGEIMIDINQELEENDENDIEKINILYNEKTGTIEEQNNILLKTPEKGKKAIILAAAAMTVIASIVIYLTMHNNNPVQNTSIPKTEPLAEPLAEPVSEPLATPDTTAEQLPKTKPSLENTAQQAQKSIDKKPIPIEPEFLEVKKLTWAVPDYVSYNDDFKNFLQTAGKSIRLTLSSDLLLATEYAYSNQINTDITLTPDGNLQDAKIAQSSGSKQIDEIVLQTVKQTLNVLKAPPNVIVGDNIHLTLKIYL